MSGKIAVIGLGYVGLPLAVAFAKKFSDVIGFDVNREKIQLLQEGIDPTGETDQGDFEASSMKISCDEQSIKGADVFIVAVPTPVDDSHRPDLSILEKASEVVGRALKKGSVVCYESTVYPGVTEEFCGPILERVSGLRRGVDFTLGYSPERINPGDELHRFETIVKVVSGEDPSTLDLLADIYGAVVTAGIHRAPSIQVAEAAKVIENTQRDLNIALMNELSLIFDRMGLRTADVLEAAGTKWNFLKFSPGLVGGHCIGVDPYYLTYRSESLGYIPEVILSGRRINDGMGRFIAEKTVKLLCCTTKAIKGARVAIMGLTFKENVPDLRNSRVPDIVAELKSYGVDPIVYDAVCDHCDALKEYGIALCTVEELCDLDAVIWAVPHDAHEPLKEVILNEGLVSAGVLVDVKSCFDPSTLPSQITYWSL